MTAPVRLLPLICLRCAQPLNAGIDEVAWSCANCQQGQLLGEDGRLSAVEIHYDASLAPGSRGKPYWVAEGRVSNLERKRYSGDNSKDMQRYWAAPRRFFVPAYEMSLEEIVAAGLRMLQSPPELLPGTPVGFQPVTVLPDDVRALAEFIVLAVEAGRKDKLSQLHFDLQLSEPELWILA